MSCEDCEYYYELTKFIESVYDPEHPQSALIAILHRAQEQYGYLSNDVMEHVAQVTKVPAAEIYGVATFYSYFKHHPQGKHYISVCMGTACYIKGAQKVLETIENILDIKKGETTRDNLFTLGETRCIGACGLAPVLTIGDHVYGRVEPDKVKEILEEYR